MSKMLRYGNMILIKKGKSGTKTPLELSGVPFKLADTIAIHYQFRDGPALVPVNLKQVLERVEDGRAGYAGSIR